MNDHPLNLTIRFLLEIIALVVIGMWGWRHDGLLRYLLVIGLPILLMVVWGTFRVPNDPGNAPVAVNGVVRLLIEALFFGAAVLALYDMDYKQLWWILLLIVIIHYAFSYDRVLRLLSL